MKDLDADGKTSANISGKIIHLMERNDGSEPWWRKKFYIILVIW